MKKGSDLDRPPISNPTENAKPTRGGKTKFDRPSKRAIVVNSVAMRSSGTSAVKNDRMADANPFPKLYKIMPKQSQLIRVYENHQKWVIRTEDKEAG